MSQYIRAGRPTRPTRLHARPSTHKGCLPAAWRTVLSDGAMPYRTSRTGRTSAVPNRTGRTGRRSFCGSYGSRQGSPLHSHRSSRDSGDDLWADRPLDLDPARVSHTPVSLSVRRPGGVGFACFARSTGLRGYAPRPRGYGAGTHKGCFDHHSSQLNI